MMSVERYDTPAEGRLIGRLPPVRGKYAEGVAMAPFTWFRVGGRAEVVFRPMDREDLAGFMADKPKDVPVTVIGVTSNLLVRDGGVQGVVVRLGKAFARTEFLNGQVRFGAATLNGNASLSALRLGRSGLEFLSGIPGSIGGGLRMNAGAYSREFKDVLIAAEGIDGAGQLQSIPVDEMGMSYRHCTAAAESIFTSGLFTAPDGDPAEIACQIESIRAARAKSQPIGARTGGSTFANPNGLKAWELIEAAGCRNLRMGGAMVSEKHCNFLINTGKATAADIEALGEEVRRRVLESSGIELRWEIQRVGVPIRIEGAGA